MKNWRRAVGVADVMTGEAHQFCERFFYTDGLRVLSMKADHRRLTRRRACVTVFIGVPLHVTAGMSVVDRCVINIATVFSGERLSPFISRASATLKRRCKNNMLLVNVWICLMIAKVVGYGTLGGSEEKNFCSLPPGHVQPHAGTSLRSRG